MVKCQSCGGTYEPILPDGMQYFHACPPISPVELQAAVTAGTIKLAPGETVDQAYARRAFERVNKRDENVTAILDAKGRAVMKAAGAGVVTVP